MLHFCQKTESFQYKAALALTGVIQGTSQEKHLAELGLETWLRRLFCMYKIINIDKPKYFTNLFANVKLVTILEIEISQFFIADLKVLKIHFSHILLRLLIA